MFGRTDAEDTCQVIEAQRRLQDSVQTAEARRMARRR